MKPLIGWARNLLGQITLYLPLVAMGLMALGTWWLASNTPVASAPEPERPPRSEPDYFLTNFVVKSFDSQGQLISEVTGTKARHFPDTDILEIDAAQLRSTKNQRQITGQSDRAYSNGDGSEVQLVGNAVVIRAASKDAQGRLLPQVEYRGEFLHAFVRTEEIKSHKPVVVTRGKDQFSGDRMAYNHIDGIVQLDGRVRVRLESKAP
ncbi:MAG: LPS export ABC transporter periplasmic protein LptC [Brachymonas sp.]